MSEKYNTSDILEVAVEALEQDGEVKICLFSVNTLELVDVNEQLRERKVMRISARNECLTATLLYLLASCNLRVGVRPFISISDVSEEGGVVGEGSHVYEHHQCLKKSRRNSPKEQ